MDLFNCAPEHENLLAFISVVNEFSGHPQVSEIYLLHNADTGKHGDSNSTDISWPDTLLTNFETVPWPTEFTIGLFEEDKWYISLLKDGVKKRSAKIKQCNLRGKDHLGWQKIKVDDGGYTMDWTSGSCRGSWE
jgi:hypothetical protein